MKIVCLTMIKEDGAERDEFINQMGAWVCRYTSCLSRKCMRLTMWLVLKTGQISFTLQLTLSLGTQHGIMFYFVNPLLHSKRHKHCVLTL